MRKWSLLAVVAGTTAALALSSAGADTAAAYPKRVCEAGKCRTVCRQDLPNGDKVDYEEGTTITVIDGKTGERFKFKCKNGDWVRVREVPGARPFDFPKRK